MRRLGRWLINAVTVFSLLLSVTTLWLTVRSYQHAEYVWVRPPYAAAGAAPRWFFFHEWGTFVVGRWGGTSDPYLRGYSKNWHWELPYCNARGAPKGFSSYDGGVAIPYWAPLLVAGALAIATTRRFAAEWSLAFAARRAGRCRTCRYELTDNVSGVCPECGTAVIGE